MSMLPVNSEIPFGCLSLYPRIPQSDRLVSRLRLSTCTLQTSCPSGRTGLCIGSPAALRHSEISLSGYTALVVLSFQILPDLQGSPSSSPISLTPPSVTCKDHRLIFTLEVFEASPSRPHTPKLWALFYICNLALFFLKKSSQFYKLAAHIKPAPISAPDYGLVGAV